MCTPLPCGTICKSVTGIWSRGLFSYRFRSYPSRHRLVLCLDEDAAGLYVHSPDSVPHVAHREWLHSIVYHIFNPTLMDINAISAVAAVGEEEPEMN